MRPLGIICPSPTDGTSIYRAMGVTHDLLDQDKNLRISLIDGNISWVQIKNTDKVFIQRPFTAQHLEVCKMVKNLNRFLWIDYDDDLLNVPMDNPTYRMYGKDNIKKMILGCLGLADVVTVSTDKLEESLRASMLAFYGYKNDIDFDKFKVVRNAFDNKDQYVVRKRSARKRIIWRGSETHVRDLMEYVPQIIKAHKEFPEHEFVFMGMAPWMLEGHIAKDKLIHVESKDPFEFFENMRRQNGDILIVPLSDNIFNKCKSNIAWIEATQSGMITLAPDWAEWRHQGVTNYRNHEDFYTKLSFLINSPEEIKQQMWLMSARYMTENFSLTTINQKRLEIIHADKKS